MNDLSMPQYFLFVGIILAEYILAVWALNNPKVVEKINKVYCKIKIHRDITIEIEKENGKIIKQSTKCNICGKVLK